MAAIDLATEVEILKKTVAEKDKIIAEQYKLIEELKGEAIRLRECWPSFVVFWTFCYLNEISLNFV